MIDKRLEIVQLNLEDHLSQVECFTNFVRLGVHKLHLNEHFPGVTFQETVSGELGLYGELFRISCTVATFEKQFWGVVHVSFEEQESQINIQTYFFDIRGSVTRKPENRPLPFGLTDTDFLNCLLSDVSENFLTRQSAVYA